LKEGPGLVKAPGLYFQKPLKMFLGWEVFATASSTPVIPSAARAALEFTGATFLSPSPWQPSHNPNASPAKPRIRSMLQAAQQQGPPMPRPSHLIILALAAALYIYALSSDKPLLALPTKPIPGPTLIVWLHSAAPRPT
jgi:hypothetical protein